ncbi:6361_t:CDS:2 [Ambispora leptoticha]|uniref:6361_t:CDS:1 n=1 Tax=Ambispora leptoticha TaxID=144679 RepID=A0A9N9EKQ1_9GLOM|nr:6361_t:CDS:2 [Ambispora leptoticha]
MEDSDGNNRSLDEAEEIMLELQAESQVEIQTIALSSQEVEKKKLEKTRKETERTALNAKIDKLVSDKLTEFRNELTTTYKIKDGFELTKKADGTVDKDNRKEYGDLLQIKIRLETIRYLESGDESKDSSDDDENTAYNNLKTIQDNYNNSKLLLFSTIPGTTSADKCKRIKETTNDLQAYHDDYENLETAFTEDLKNKWQSAEANNFKTSAKLKELLESSFLKKDDKYDDFFKHIKGGTNGYENVKDVDTWGKLLLKDPKIVIITIKRYEYDNMEDTGDDKDKKKTQLERKIKKVLNKKGIDNLTDVEINTTLYEVAIGTKTLHAKALKDDLTEYSTTDDDTGNGNQTTDDTK